MKKKLILTKYDIKGTNRTKKFNNYILQKTRKKHRNFSCVNIILNHFMTFSCDIFPVKFFLTEMLISVCLVFVLTHLSEARAILDSGK